MSRPLRIIKQNVTYHCYSRCHEERELLKQDNVKEIVLQIIRDALEQYNFRLSYIEFVDNHIHIIIRTLYGGESISKIMQYIKSRITRNYNIQLNHTGTIWNERFKSEIIEDYNNPQEKFIHLVWYISYNSVRRGNYNDPRENPYSSIHVYLNQPNVSGLPLSIHEYYQKLGNSAMERKIKFEKFEKSLIFQKKYF